MEDINKIFRILPEDKLLALCLYGEARGESQEGQVAVANVIMNRVKRGGWFGSTIPDVILKRAQFSCFNPGDPNRLMLVAMAYTWETYYPKKKPLRDCWRIAQGVIPGEIKDNTGGATHYKTINCNAAWAEKMQLVAAIGNHQFYKEA